MRIGVDIDGVLSKTFEKWVECLNEEGHEISMDDYVYDDGYPDLPDADLKEWYADNFMRLRLEYDAYPGARAVLSLLSEHDIVLLTNRFNGPDNSHDEEESCPLTESWLRSNGLLAGAVVHTKDKVRYMEENGISLIIEDTPKNALAAVDHGVRVLLKDQVYNRHVNHPLITRFSHWAEVPRLLRRIV